MEWNRHTVRFTNNGPGYENAVNINQGALASIYRLYELLQKDIRVAKAATTPYAKTKLDRLSKYLQTHVLDELLTINAGPGIERVEGNVFWRMKPSRFDEETAINNEDAMELIDELIEKSVLLPGFKTDVDNLLRGVFELQFSSSARFPKAMKKRMNTYKKPKHPGLNQLCRVAAFSNTSFKRLPENIVTKIGEYVKTRKTAKSKSPKHSRPATTLRDDFILVPRNEMWRYRN